MGIFDKIKGEFIDIIEWTDDSTDTLVYKYPDRDKAIKRGAQLTVRESQVAILVNEGVIADVYGPGRHELETKNMPILTTLESWKYGFESPFKVDIFFVSTKQFTNEKWGTVHPVPIRDKEFGLIRIRAFGIFAFKIDDAATFLKEVFGTCASFQTEDITGHMKNAMVSQLADMLAESGVPLIDMASQYDELSASGLTGFSKIFSDFGLRLTQFFVQNVSAPKEVEEMMDAKSQMNIVGDMNQYAQFQTAQAIKDAANNPSGGLAGAGVGLGAGAAMGNMMGNAFNNQGGSNSAPKVLCPHCGASVDQGKKFCPDCGEKMTVEMDACGSCGHRLKKDAKFCPECGAKQGSIACNNCGAKHKAGTKFCAECGEKV